MTPRRSEVLASAPAPAGARADAVEDLVVAVQGVALSGTMEAWLDRLAIVFADWHERVVEVLERHPALDPDACWERPSVVPVSYRTEIVRLVYGIGAPDATDTEPLSAALLELAGGFGRAFEPLRRGDGAAFRRIHAASVVLPPPYGSPSGLTARFVADVHHVLEAVTGPGLGSDDIRRQVLEHKGRWFAALDRLRAATANPEAIAS